MNRFGTHAAALDRFHQSDGTATARDRRRAVSATWPGRSSQAQHEADLAAARGSVALPGALRAKYPAAPRDWGWQWVFPATRFYRDADSSERRRHHLHER